MGLHLSLSGWKSWITFGGMKGSCWNFHDLTNSVKVISGLSYQISQLPGYGLGQKQPVSWKSLFPLSFCHTVMRHTFLETTGLRQKRVWNFDFLA
jgi:hypothetical protein